MTRGRAAEIRDPAVAIAAGKCWLARWNSNPFLQVAVDAAHPAECGFCDYPDRQLIKALDEFIAWANLRPTVQMGEATAMRAEIEMFQTLPGEEQHRLVRNAQGYVREDEE